MTVQDYRKIKAMIIKLYLKNEITKEEGLATIKVLQKTYGKCITCDYNDGYPHSRCYNCE